MRQNAVRRFAAAISSNCRIGFLEWSHVALGFIEREKAMHKKISLAAAILATVALPATEAMALRASGVHDDYRVVYHRSNHRGFHAGYREGYDAGYRRGYYTGGYYHPGDSVSATPAEWLGAALLGAKYGSWSDGYWTYGGDPCYQYNDRDWAFERVC